MDMASSFKNYALPQSTGKRNYLAPIFVDFTASLPFGKLQCSPKRYTIKFNKGTILIDR